MFRILHVLMKIPVKLFTQKATSYLRETKILLMIILISSTLVDAQQIGTGSGFSTIVVNEDGKVYGWGANSLGQLGIGNFDNYRLTPVTPDASGVLSGKTISQVAVGLYHTVVLDSDGKVYTWGFNNNGQLGNGNLTNSNIPVSVVDGAVSFTGRTVTNISAGREHTIAVVANSKIFTWGDNGSGQLGNGTNTDSNVPVQVVNTGVLSGKTILKVYAGDSYSAALDSDGKVYTWGYNAYGQLGNGITFTDSNVPVAVIDGDINFTSKEITSLALGSTHVIALDSDGKVYSWGDNISGQLGNGTTTDSNIPVAVNMSGVLAGKTIIAVSAGSSHAIALSSEGKVYTWGLNDNGQLGNGNIVNSNVPVEVDMTGVLNGKTIIDIGAGYSHSIALASDGAVYTWGNNDNGQLGNGTQIDSRVPVEVDISTMGGLITAVPSVQASNINFTSVTTYSMEVSWTRGNGSRRAVFMKQGTGSYVPTDNITYSANSVFGTGDQMDASGWYCIYNGTGTSVSVTGLLPATNYRVRVFEYNGGNGSETYLTTTGTNNPSGQTTSEVSAPSIQAQSIVFSNISSANFTVDWTNGNGENVLFL